MEGLYKVGTMPTEGQFIGVDLSGGVPRADTYCWEGSRLCLLGVNDVVVDPFTVKYYGYTFYVADRRKCDRRKA